MLLAGTRPLEVAKHFKVTRATLYNRLKLRKIMQKMKAKRKRQRLKRRQ